MFSELVESVVVKNKTRKGWAIMASAIVQSVGLMIAFLIPLIYTQALPTAVAGVLFIAPAPSLPPHTASQDAAPKVRQRGRPFQHNILHEPIFIPKNVEMIQEPRLPPEASADSQTGGPNSVNLLENLRTGPTAPTPQPPPQPPAPSATQPIKQGGAIQAAKIVYQPQPVYPVLARQAGIQGTVLLHAVVDQDGNVGALQVISGPPLLVRAALDAVKQWRYQPTLLNGEPVEVETTITVSFILGG